MSAKEDIQEKFKNMIKSSISHISISQICQEANVSRKTFYKYYDDIYDLIQQIIQHDLFEPLTQLSTMDHLKANDSITVLNSMYSTIYKQKDFYSHLYYRYKEEDVLKQCIFKENVKLNTVIFQNIHEDETEKNYHIHIAAMAGANLIEKWIVEDYSISSRQLAEIFYKYIARAWVELLERYR